MASFLRAASSFQLTVIPNPRRLFANAKARAALTAAALLAGPLAGQADAAGATGNNGSFQFTVTPNPSGAPGGSGIQSAIDVIAAYALYAAAAGFLLGAALWAVGGRIGNDYTATGGKIGMFTSLAVVFLIGMAPQLLQWSFGLG
jgi:hypothetical protein